MRQRKLPSWVGVVIVQLSNGYFYFGVINSIMLSITLWATAGPMVKEVIPWANYWLFLLAGVIITAIVLMLDYVFIYPVRQRFINEQACKHENPAMEELKKHTKWFKQISEKIGVELKEDD